MIWILDSRSRCYYLWNWLPTDSTRNMRTVGQSPWDDIKILGQSMGHLISNSKSGGTAPPLSFPPAALPCWCHECLSQEVLTNERLGKNKEVCNCLCKQWSFFDMGITPVAGTRVGHWYQNLRKNPGTLISKQEGNGPTDSRAMVDGSGLS